MKKVIKENKSIRGVVLESYKLCKFCSFKMTRKRMPCGAMETVKQYNKRVFCSKKCFSKNLIGKEVKHRSLITIGRGRSIARNLLSKSLCKICNTKDGRDVHHIDENPLNNSLNNLIRVCRGCHTSIHKGGKTCSIEKCENKHKGHGYCDKHYQRFKKYGNPLTTKYNINNVAIL